MIFIGSVRCGVLRVGAEEMPRGAVYGLEEVLHQLCQRGPKILLSA